MSRKVYGYGRASTDRQQISLERQQEVCENYFKMKLALGEDIEWAGWFADADVTAKIPWPERPMGEIVFEKTEKGDAIVVSNFDRAFRSVVDCDNCLRIVNERELALVILDVDVNTQSPLGRAFMKIIAVLKELEREEISRRTKEGLAQIRKRGGVWGCIAPIGWKRHGKRPNGYFKPDIKERRWAKWIAQEHYVMGRTFSDIAKEMKQRNAKTPRGKGWKVHRVAKAYVAYQLGFPKIPVKEMPSPSDTERINSLRASLQLSPQSHQFFSGLSQQLVSDPDPLLESHSQVET